MSKGTKPSGGQTSAEVVILLGSESDKPVAEAIPPFLDRFGISWRLVVASAHRQPAKLRRVLARCDREGTRIYIAIAGMAAHLPGVVASLTSRPVVGVPVASGALAGVDALLSMVQMPPGVPVATVAIGPAGAKNAAILAARILALLDRGVADRLDAYRRELARGRR